MSNYVCYYHAACIDGWAAALAVHKHHFQNNEKVSLTGAVYNRTIPSTTKSVVYVVDFSFNLDEMITLLESNEKLYVFDHHKSAKANLEGLQIYAEEMGLEEKLTIIYDESRSGALITWEYFFLHATPHWIHHVQDYDLWRKKIRNTDAVVKALYSYRFDLEEPVWHNLVNTATASNELENLIHRGNILLEQEAKEIATTLEGAEFINFMGYVVPVVQVPVWIKNEVLTILAKDRPFAIGWQLDKDRYKFSLRERDSGIDLTEIGKLFDGGGHKSATGFMLDVNGRSANQALFKASAWPLFKINIASKWNEVLMFIKKFTH